MATKIFNSISVSNIKDIIDYIMPYLKYKSVIALTGELGAGKTFFTKSISAALGFNYNSVTSPTFTLINQYENPNCDFILNHIDVYRLNSIDELENIGYYDFIDNEKYLNIIEWADKIIDALPKKNIIKIDIKYPPDTIAGLEDSRNYSVEIY